MTMKPYAGVRILDLTHDLGRYVGRLFADLGATVLRVEPPGGLPDRVRMAVDPAPELAAAFAFLNASKQSVVLDFETAEGMRQFAQLAANADVIVVESEGPLYADLGRLKALAPARVTLTSVSPFGREGPRADDPACDLILQAAGGIAWLSGRPGEPPLRLPDGQATMITGVYAAVATALALTDAETNGRGHVIDVSAQECIAHSLQNSIQVYDFEDRVSMRGGEGTRDCTEDIFRCKDGFVFLAAPQALGMSWNALIGFIRDAGDPAAAYFGNERWKDRAWRLTRQAKDLFREHIEPFMLERSKEDLTREAIARKIVMAPVSTIADMFSDPQLVDRAFFTEVAADRPAKIRFPGAPYVLSAPVWSVAPAPPLGAHCQSISGAAA